MPVENFFTGAEAADWIISRTSRLLKLKRQEKTYSPIVTKIIKYMHSNFNTDISLDMLSEILGVTPSYISYLIKRELGQTFTEYLLDIRMIKLCEFLREDDYTIREPLIKE